MRVYLLFSLLLLLPSLLSGQESRVRVVADTAHITVGDRITFQVSVDHPIGSEVVWPDSINLGPFELLEGHALPPQSIESGVRSSWALILTAFELGELEIPTFDLDVVTLDGGRTTLATDRYGIQVSSVGLDEGSDIRDLRGLFWLQRGAAGFFLLALGALLILILTVVIWRWWRRKNSVASPSGPAVPPRPPHEVALEGFDRLASSPLLQRGEVKEFHIQAAEILRVYVEGRFRVPALEMTTSFITAGLRRAGVEPDLLGCFGNFLDRCDLVKFAKNRPQEEQSLELLALGRRLVEETMVEQEDENGVAPKYQSDSELVEQAPDDREKRQTDVADTVSMEGVGGDSDTLSVPQSLQGGNIKSDANLQDTPSGLDTDIHTLPSDPQIDVDVAGTEDEESKDGSVKASNLQSDHMLRDGEV